jgi:hypothetical protein
MSSIAPDLRPAAIGAVMQTFDGFPLGPVELRRPRQPGVQGQKPRRSKREAAPPLSRHRYDSPDQRHISLPAA